VFGNSKLLRRTQPFKVQTRVFFMWVGQVGRGAAVAVIKAQAKFDWRWLESVVRADWRRRGRWL
jgi:hypothetical protein